MEVPAISKPVLGFFRGIAHRYFRRQFHAVWLRGQHHFLALSSRDTGPLIVYANHSSWWDPMVSVLLAEQMPARGHFAPMDAASLDRYRILKRIGIFPIEPNSTRGAVHFLRMGETILRSGGALWVTPQGNFADPRERPLVFKPGLAALAVRTAPCTLLPLAIEYPFWNERLPECLLSFGNPIQIAAGETAPAVQDRARAALESAMDSLKDAALRRHAAGFSRLARGTIGPGGFYALGHRLKALLLRTPYRAEHTPAAPPTAPATGSGDTHA